MKRIAVVCAMLCGILFSGEALAGELKMGVVNIPRVFEGYVRVKDGAEKLRKEFGPEETVLEKTEIELRKLKDKLEVDPRPKTDINFYTEFQKLQFMTLEHDNRKRAIMQRAAEKQREEMKQILTEMRNAIRVVSASEGMHFIMRAPEWEDSMGAGTSLAPAAGTPGAADEKESKEPKSAQMLVGLFRENPLIHYTPSMDISDRVIKLLNDEYHARKQQK